MAKRSQFRASAVQQVVMLAMVVDAEGGWLLRAKSGCENIVTARTEYPMNLCKLLVIND
jgi:hypothetical protein